MFILIPAGFAVSDEQVIGGENNRTDYYFDINADNDGNGSKETPFKNFADNRVLDNSNIHLASGEYVFEKTRSFSNISFEGLNPQSTILNGNGCTLTVNGEICFNNLTLTNFKLINKGNFNASNSILTKLIPTHTVYDNNFGGAIYAPSNKNIYLENCTIFDNSARYGAALYVKGGSLTIINSLFYNNIAYSFAGAIAGESVKIRINNSRFNNCSSLGDAGGALYLLSSSLNAWNLTVNNSSSTFGAAITALNSNLNISDSIFENNHAKYNGGAIYQFYGSVELNSSKFINNSAYNGGALFINDASVLNITNNDFTDNYASNYAGAVYYFLNNDINLTSNFFKDNIAGQFNDSYRMISVDLVIGNGNYTIYVNNQTFNSTLPEKYDLRDYNYVTPVKDQENGGNCWAFAPLAALESCILKATGTILDLSEGNMKNLAAYFSDYARNGASPNTGGNDEMAIAYLVSWLGPVNELDDLYDDLNHISPVLNSIVHVQNVIYLKRDNFTDNDAIKQTIMNYGAVATSMRFDSSYTKFYNGIVHHYYTGNDAANHAVTIVGWDDNYSKNNFRTAPPGDGAWIVKNSWGPSWYTGYFYVSYYDTVFARPGTYASYTFILNESNHFDKNYQYDFAGPTDYLWFNQNSVWYENAFYATDDEFLSAVSTYFNKNTDWEINVYVNSKLQIVQKGSAVNGYFTINLDYPIPLVKGDLFEIIFKITVDGDVGFPITEAVSTTKCTYYPRCSFVSTDNGKTWYDLYDFKGYGYPGHSYSSQVACIKGFTQFLTLNSTFRELNINYDSLDLFNIVAWVVDENNNPVGNGNVTFNVNGINYTALIYRGIASLLVPLKIGLNNISAVFSSPNYYSSQINTTYNVLPVSVDIKVDVGQQSNNAYITFNISQPVNETLLITINGENSTVEIVNGTYMLNLTDLDYGDYNVNIKILSDFYSGENSTGFFVNVKRTYLEVSDMTAVYNGGEYLNIYLYDQFNQKLNNTQIRIILNNTTYLKTTDDEGKVIIPINLTVGVYKLDVFFEGNESYLESQNSSCINVTRSGSWINITEIVYDSFNFFNIGAEVFDQFNQRVTEGTLTLIVNNVKYDNFRVPFVVGKNNISLAFESPLYYSSALNVSYEVSPVVLDMTIGVIQNFNNAYVTVNLSQSVNETLLISVNGINSTVKSINGSYEFNLSGLEYGNNLIDIKLSSDFYTAWNQTVFFVNVKRTNLEVNNLTTVYNSGENFNVKLTDQFNQPVINKIIRFYLDDKVYSNVTDTNGIAYISVNLIDSNYQIMVSFEGDELYIGSMKSSTITVKSSLTLPVNDIYTLNADYEVYLIDKHGNPLNNIKIKFTINNADYTVTCNDGKAIIPVPVKSGDYIISIENPETGEVKSQNIHVLPRISENTDIITYYGANRYFKVKVLGDNGEIADHGEIVLFKLNGNTYKVRVDSNGYASLKIILKSGTYQVTVSYKGYEVSNKIIIKPTLITKNIKVKKGKTAKFTAKLLDINGNVLKNKKIKFKIKGKTYTAKTNKKGIAKITIINLKSGKYNIVTKYSKLKNKNIITVKK